MPFIWRDTAERRQAAAASHGSDSLEQTHQHTMDEVCGTIDIARTVLARCGLAPYNGMQGLNLLPCIELAERATGHESTGLDAAPKAARPGIIVESEPVVLPHGRTRRYRLRSLIQQRWRLTLSNLPELCELYDLQADPLEQHNLWDERVAERGQLCAQLLMELSEQADCSPLPTAIA